jgi:hypothetical protein
MPEHLRTRQWSVTDFGIEPLPGIPYAEINKKRLLETRLSSNERFYDWPLQMEEKEWCDISDFIRAWMFAIERHCSSQVDYAIMANTVFKAMKDRMASLETLLGEASAQIPGYFDQRLTAIRFQDIDRLARDEDEARSRWRSFRYAQARR